MQIRVSADKQCCVAGTIERTGSNFATVEHLQAIEYEYFSFTGDRSVRSLCYCALFGIHFHLSGRRSIRKRYRFRNTPARGTARSWFLDSLECRCKRLRPPGRDTGSTIDSVEASMRWTLVFIIATIAVCGDYTAAQGVDPNAARSIAAGCANCHGTNGVSQGGIGSLAGENKDDIMRKMQEFRAGSRQGTIMPQLAKGYTDAQIELAAGWFAAQKAGK
jgi:cytochrome subunit of sulfide dehydrogenase